MPHVVMNVERAVLTGHVRNSTLQHRVYAVVTIGHGDRGITTRANRRLQSGPRASDGCTDQLDVSSRSATRGVASRHCTCDVELNAPRREHLAAVTRPRRDAGAVGQKRWDALQVAAWLGEIASSSGISHQLFDAPDRRCGACLCGEIVSCFGE